MIEFVNNTGFCMAANITIFRNFVDSFDISLPNIPPNLQLIRFFYSII